MTPVSGVNTYTVRATELTLSPPQPLFRDGECHDEDERHELMRCRSGDRRDKVEGERTHDDQVGATECEIEQGRGLWKQQGEPLEWKQGLIMYMNPLSSFDSSVCKLQECSCHD